MLDVLVLRLEGVLQSWGEHSIWNWRDTSLMPSKSGIVGLLSCALGYPREDNRIIELSRNIQIAVRADRHGQILSDFHSITSDRGITTANGKKRPSDDNTLITNRQYLQDASFTVFIVAKKDLLEQIENALNNPVWPIYLGRKSCIPSCPVCEGIFSFSSIQDAIENYKFSIRDDADKLSLKNVFMVEIEDGLVNLDDNKISRSDEPIGHRQFASRYVYRKLMPRKADYYVSD